jgi:Phytanoyl-CoA dioxygenase (PhyH)
VPALLTKARLARRDLSFMVGDHLHPIEVGDPDWVPSEDDKQHWRDHGWVILRGSVDLDVIDQLKQEIQDYRDQHRSETVNSKTGDGLRIGLLHAANRKSREMGFNCQARTFLRWAFEDEPVLFGSLTFDIGSEQESHIDAAFFYTQPETSMAGVWTAFEDIADQAGPVFYVDGSHEWPRLKAADVLAEDPELNARVQASRAAGAAEPDLELSDEVYKAYIAKVERLVEADPKGQLPAMLKKGDVLIWHPWLVHGGLPRLSRDLTRRSMVVHYIGASSKMWDQHEFFLHGDELESRKPINFTIRSSRGRPYVWHPGPVNFSMGDGHFEA